VVGSITDLSAVYYNPGTLALQKDPTFLLGAKAFQYQSVVLKNAQGESTPLQSSRFGPAPSMFAVMLPPTLMNGALGFSVFTRSEFKARIEAFGSTVLFDQPPDSLAAVGGEFYVDQDLIDAWGGPTWARSWGKMGVGLSGFVAYHGQRSRNQALLQGLKTPDEGASATFIDMVDYWNVRLVFKMGFAWDYDPLTFGFALTSPGVGLFGDGSSLVDVFINGIDLDGDGEADTELIANGVKDASAQYKSPGSISFGFSYRYKMTTIHGSAEYFEGVNRYEVMNTVAFESPTTGKTYLHEMTMESNDVFNWGLGLERHIKPWLKAYGSFITDRSTAVENVTSTLAVSSWDLYHVMGGTAFTFWGNDITLGVGYSWGSDKSPQPVEIPTSSGTVQSPLHSFDGTIQYRQLKFIVGFSFGTGGKSSGS
jgi:hypothetical protein